MIRTVKDYLDWKSSTLQLFSSVQDLDTLARIIRRKRCELQEIKNLLFCTLVNGVLILIITFIVNNAIDIILDLNICSWTILFCAAVCIIFISIASGVILSFYEEFLAIIEWLDKCRTD